MFVLVNQNLSSYKKRNRITKDHLLTSLDGVAGHDGLVSDLGTMHRQQSRTFIKYVRLVIQCFNLPGLVKCALVVNFQIDDRQLSKARKDLDRKITLRIEKAVAHQVTFFVHRFIDEVELAEDA